MNKETTSKNIKEFIEKKDFSWESIHVVDNSPVEKKYFFGYSRIYVNREKP